MPTICWPAGLHAGYADNADNLLACWPAVGYADNADNLLACWPAVGYADNADNLLACWPAVGYADNADNLLACMLAPTQGQANRASGYGVFTNKFFLI